MDGRKNTLLMSCFVATNKAIYTPYRFSPKIKWADAFSIHPPTAQMEHARDLKFCKILPRGNR